MKHRGNKRLENNEHQWVTSQPISGGLTYVKLESQNRRKGGGRWRILEKITVDIIPNMMTTINP